MEPSRIDPLVGRKPLTHAEARQRAQLITVSSYTIDLDLTRGVEVFGSTTVVRFSCTTPGAASFIELRAARVTSATLNGRRLDVDLPPGNRLAVEDLQPDNEIVVEAEMPYSTTGEGMHRFVDPVDGETYVGAYLGGDNAQRVFANFDQPDLKAAIQVNALVPDGWTVVSNGMRQAGGSGRWEFAATPPVSTYLVVLVAGPLHSRRTVHRGVPFALHCRRSLADHLDKQAEEMFDITRSCFDRYLDLFDVPYPFDAYDQAFVPELNWGALETPGCVIFRDDFVYRSAVTDVERQDRGMVIAHEMAHMWFGDLVTMRWWDDLWLSESFAEYMGFQVLSEATRFSDTWTQFAVARKTWGYDADQRPSTHPVAADAAAVSDTDRALANFDGISYAKGASALRQMVAWLGHEVFLRGVNDFLTRHSLGVATLADLLDSLSAVAGLDVHQWAQRWLRTTGVDTLRMARDPGASHRTRIEHAGLRPHRVALGLYDRAVDDPSRLVLRRRLQVSLEAGTTDTAVGLAASEPRPDLLLLNDGDLSYCKVRFDVDSWGALTGGLSSIDDPLSRAVVWTAARDMVRDGDLRPTDYLTLVRRQLPSETDIAIVQGVLGFVRRHVVDRYLDHSDRGGALVGLGDLCREIIERAGDGTAPGLRLAAVRGMIDSATDPDGIGELRSSLEAGEIPGGPPLDSDLQWRILLRLSILGAVELPEIEAELHRDESGAGRQRAARCRAAFPLLSAKEAAWHGMFGVAGDDRGELSTSLVAATAQGFWQPEHVVLLAPFVHRYFPAAVEVAARRGAAVSAAIGRDGFPVFAIDEATLRAGERCIANGNPATVLRRELTDQLDDLRRALRLRSRWAC